MKIQSYKFPKSSFLSMEKDSTLIINKILGNQNIKKMLYYPVRECLSMPNLNQEQTYSLIENNISFIPKIKISDDLRSYLFISFDNFITNETNPEFRDNTIIFDIICHTDLWNLGDFKLRPYKIAGELDSMLNNTHLTGIGELNFMGASVLRINEDFAGLTLMYSAIHGEEDKVK